MSQVLKPKKGYKKVKWLFGKEIEIPGEWENKTLEFVGTLQGGFAFKSEDYVNYGIGLLKIANVSHGQIIWNEKSYVPKEYWNKYSDFQIQKGDVVIAMTRPLISGGMKIAFFSIKEKILLNQRVGRFIIKNIDKKFFYSLLNKKSFIDQIKTKLSESGQPNISSDEIEKIKIYFPKNISEQQKIASILSNVDNLIINTQKIINQTKSVKKGLMQKLLTKGIGHKKFKKVKFHFGKIIKIPEEWEVKQLKEYVSKIGSGVTPKGGSSVYLKKGIPLIRSQNVHFEGLSLENVAFISEEIHNDMKNTQLMEYDVLLNITGASIGRCTYIPTNFGEGNVNQHVCIIRPKAKLFYSFLAYVLSSNLLQNIIQSSQVGLSREGLNFKEMGDFVFPLPSLPEQQQIATILSNVDSQIQSQTQYKEKLEKLKKSLMQKLLTGEVRVSI